MLTARFTARLFCLASVALCVLAALGFVQAEIALGFAAVVSAVLAVSLVADARRAQRFDLVLSRCVVVAVVPREGPSGYVSVIVLPDVAKTVHPHLDEVLETPQLWHLPLATTNNAELLDACILAQLLSHPVEVVLHCSNVSPNGVAAVELSVPAQEFACSASWSV